MERRAMSLLDVGAFARAFREGLSEFRIAHWYAAADDPQGTTLVIQGGFDHCGTKVNVELRMNAKALIANHKSMQSIVDALQ
jgi:hypothetical protein